MKEINDRTRFVEWVSQTDVDHSSLYEGLFLKEKKRPEDDGQTLTYYPIIMKIRNRLLDSHSSLPGFSTTDQHPRGGLIPEGRGAGASAEAGQGDDDNYSKSTNITTEKPYMMESGFLKFVAYFPA